MTDRAWDDDGSDSAVPAPAEVTLVIGPEEFLAERAVARLVARAKELDPDVDVRRLVGPELEPGTLDELTSPSLFGDTTVLVYPRPDHQPADNLRAGSDRLERSFIAANVDLRSFKPVSAVEILIAYDLWSRILSTISGGRTCPQMKVA
jgi:hypothetical protein